MSLWRIRITMSDDPQSQAMLTAALAEQRVWALPMSRRDTDMTGDVIIELLHVMTTSALCSATCT